MDTIILSGGNIQEDFALDFLNHQKNYLLIAADKGMDFCHRHGLWPAHIVGDFDSGNIDALYVLQERAIVHRLQPEKDDSDTQSAVRLAISLGAKRIWILGATGTRLDHVFANLGLLSHGLDIGVEIILLDAYNRMTAHRKGFQIDASTQFGDYISFFSIGGPVKDLTLRGFKYPLQNHFLQPADCGLTVSNELTAPVATVTFSSGTLLMIQSRD